MSGNTWDNNWYKIEMAICAMLYEDDENNLEKDFPRLVGVLEKLADTLPDIIKKLDYHYAADKVIDDKPAFEKESLEELKQLIEGIE